LIWRSDFAYFEGCLTKILRWLFNAQIVGPREVRACPKSRNLELTNIHSGFLKNNGPPLALKRRSDASADRCFTYCS
jgi:hypothetical protein